jgi:membrane dipeptidase
MKTRGIASSIAAAASLLLAACATTPAQEGREPATDLLTVDSHVDIPDAYMREPRFDAGADSVLQADLAKMRQGGLDSIFLVVYVGQGPLTEPGYAEAVAKAENKFSAIDRLLQKYPDRIRVAKTPAQMRANHEAGLLSAAIGVENGYALGHDLARLDEFHARGASYLGLVHAGDNDLCTSSAPDAKLGQPVPAVAGLTEFGRQVVRRANEIGVMVDVSHASDACIRDALQASVAPIIASHSSARALVAHPRNLPDELAKAIAEKGGVIQVVAYREFVKTDPERYAAQEKLEAEIAHRAGDAEYDSEKHEYLPSTKLALAELERQHPLATVEHFVDHIRYLVDLVGVDHVGIASDFDGTGGVTGWMDASQTGNVTAALRRRGFSDADIAKIWGGNLLRTWSEVESQARQP